MDKLGPWFERTLRIFGRFWLPFSLVMFVVLIATVVGSFLICIPLIIGGPLAVGLARASFATLRGEPPTFEHVMSGFQQFGSSFVAMLIYMLASVLPAGLIGAGMSLFIMGTTAMTTQSQGSAQQVAPILMVGGMVIFAVLMLLMMVVNWWITVRLIFTFSIIADHPETSGIDAIKQSWALTTGRSGPLFIFLFGIYFLSTLGMIACYVGIVFTIALLPIAIAVAYADLTGMNTDEDDLRPYMPPSVTPS